MKISMAGWRLASLIAAVPGVATAGHAQEAATAPAAASGEGSGADDIVVTAQRRAESLQKVPISVTAVQPAQMERLNLRNVDQLQTVTPGLVFNTGFAFAQTFIRGVGSSFPTPGLEGSVATYVDGAYLARGIGTIFDLVDPATVQILKGPQGTLYGRNATGGAIILNSADPTDKLEGRVLGEYGRFNHALGEAVLNVPLSETLSARIVGRYTRDDGYIHNLTTNKTVNGDDSYDVRGKLAWRPYAHFSSVLTVERSRQRSDTTPHANRLQPPLCLGCVVAGEAPVRGFFAVRNDLTGPDSIAQSTSVNLRSKLSSGIFDLESVTAYRKLSFRAYNDLDATSSPLVVVTADLGGKTFTQDFTVSTNSGSWVDGIFGVSYLHDDGYYAASLFGGAFDALTQATGDVPRTLNKIRSTSVAAYGEATLKPVEGLRITLGGRYTYDDRQLHATTSLAGNIAFVGGVGPLSFDQNVSFRSFTPRAVIAYDFGPVSVYGSYNRGFKAGGFSTPAYGPDFAVRPEKIDSYEIGAKYVSSDHRLRISLSAFHYDQTNLQVRVVDLTKGSGVVRNAASSRGNGVEAEFSYAPMRGISIFGGANYLDAKFRNFAGASVNLVTPAGFVPGFEDLSGFTLPNAPKFSADLGTDLEFPINSAWKTGFSAVARYTSRYDFYAGAGGNLRFDRQPKMLLINASGYVGPADGHWQLGFYINNLTNKKYFVEKQSSAPFGAYDDVARPRTFGARAKYEF